MWMCLEQGYGVSSVDGQFLQLYVCNAYIYMHTNRYYIIDAIDINIHRFDYICIFLLCTYVYIYAYIYIYVFAYTRQQFQCIYDETHTHIYICIPTSLQKKTHVFIPDMVWFLAGNPTF